MKKPTAKYATKRSRERDGEETTTTKKLPFGRIWSEEDVIRVLQGVIDHKNDTKVSPFDNMDEFYQVVKKFIGFDATKIQLTEKLRKLKRKFENNLAKVKKGDWEPPVFPNAYERKVFELSKVIWGALPLESNEIPKKKRPKLERVESDERKKGEETDDETFEKCCLVKSLATYGVDDVAAKHGWSKLGLEDKKGFEEKWKTVKLREFEVFSQKRDFLKELLTKMVEAFP